MAKPKLPVEKSERRPEVAAIAERLRKEHPRWSTERVVTEAKSLHCAGVRK